MSDTRAPRINPERARKASEVVSEYRKEIIDKVTYWTGVRRPLVKALLEAVLKKLDELDLVVDTKREREEIVELTVYVTTLATNYFSPRRMPPKNGPTQNGDEQSGTAEAVIK